MSHYILPYSGIDLQSKNGLQTLCDFAERNQLMDEQFIIVCDIMISKEEEVAAEMMSDYWDTLMSAKPNCFDQSMLLVET